MFARTRVLVFLPQWGQSLTTYLRAKRIHIPKALYENGDIKSLEDKNKHVIIGVSSDRGLCGAIHSNVAKAMKSEGSKLTSAGKEVMLVNIGDKLRALLYRTHRKHILLNCKEMGRKPPTFTDAFIIASDLLNSD